VKAHAKTMTSGTPTHGHKKWPGIPADTKIIAKATNALVNPYRFRPLHMAASSSFLSVARLDLPPPCIRAIVLRLEISVGEFHFFQRLRPERLQIGVDAIIGKIWRFSDVSATHPI
jgi:hypothetical protein